MSLPAPTELASGIPVPRTSLVGRQDEVRRIVELLRSEDVPLVTITGPGGAGKTRLALQVASSINDDFPGGVWFVPLSSLDDADLVMPSVARALGLRESGTAPVAQRIASRLRDTRSLIVLDNFEQVRVAAGELAELLRACQGVNLLVTSRVVLRLSIEHVFAISGLPLPDEDAQPSLDSVEGNEAVRLFVTRAQANDSNFRLTAENVRVVADICRQLDGLPLGIELAAARVRTLSPHAIQARLSNRLKVLRSDFNDLPERHRTVRDTVAWSVQLLTPAERELFYQLSVFGDPFTLEAVVAVAGNGGTEQGDDIALLDPLSSLVDQSLLNRVATGDDMPVFRMLMMVSDYGREQLAERGTIDEVRGKLARYFLEFAERAAPHLSAADQVRWLDALDRSIGDLRAAMEWFATHGEPVAHLRLAVALWRFAYTRGRMGEARQWLRSARENYQELTSLRAEALNAEGLLAGMQDDLDVATEYLSEAMSISEKLDDDLNRARAFNGMGDVLTARGERERAVEHYDAARALFSRLGDRSAEGRVLTNLGNLYWDGEQLDLAVGHHRAALERFRASGDVRGMVWSLTSLGTLLGELGDGVESVPYLKDAMEKARLLGDPGSVVTIIEGFAAIVLQRGEYETAATVYSACESIRERIGMPHLGNFIRMQKTREHRLRLQLGTRFEEAWERGRSMPIEEAAALAAERSSLVAATPQKPDGIPEIVRMHGVTRREMDVIRMIAAGKTDREISEALSISHRTVGTHVSNILGKLDMPNRSALGAFAQRHNII